VPLRGRTPWKLRLTALLASCVVATLAVPSELAHATSRLRWSGPAQVDPTFAPTAVSCASSSFCIAPSEEGTAETFTGSSWSAPVLIDGGERVNSVSCPSVSLCVAVDNHGHAVTFNGSSWSAPVLIDGGESLESVSCPSASFCLAVGYTPTSKPGTYEGLAVIFNGSS
jgi:hypothetical protein